MTQFKFKRSAAMYKNKKGDKTTISNGNMTDEKAVEFLKTNPERISLFSDYPSNWETLLFPDAEEETEMNKDLRLAAEAEAKVVAKVAEVPVEEVVEEVIVKDSEELESDAVKEATEVAEKAAEDALKPSRKDLERMSLKDLRKKFPEVKATSIKAFLDIVFE